MRRKDIIKCPVCGKENLRIEWTEGGYTVESYYICRNCTYLETMAYSPTTIAVCKGYNRKYDDAICAVGADVVSDEEYGQICCGFPSEMMSEGDEN